MFRKLLLIISIFLWAFNIWAYKPDISLCIADCKFDGRSIKICEFGEAQRSTFTGYDRLYGVGAAWRCFWNFLGTFNIPIWFVNYFANDRERAVFSYKDFVKAGGITIGTLYTLEKKLAMKEFDTCDNQLDNYRALVMVRSNNYLSDELIKFKENHSDVLLVNDASGPFVNDKFLTHLLFCNGLEDFRPKCSVCDVDYSPQTSKDTLDNIENKWLLIKPIGASLGNGIIFVERNCLDEVLKKILQKEDLLRVNDRAYSHWKDERHKIFLVEAYAPSKNVFVRRQWYDATMRVLFALVHGCKDHNELTQVRILGAYWKLPIKSLTEEGSFDEKHRSNVHAEGPCSAKVDDCDFKKVQEILVPVLESVYKRMLSDRDIGWPLVYSGKLCEKKGLKSWGHVVEKQEKKVKSC